MPGRVLAEETESENSASFMKRNAKSKNVVVLPGLQYRVVKSGPAEGVSPKTSDLVAVHYEGRLPSGEIFDSSLKRGAPENLEVRKLIPGWQVALKLMRPGDEWEIFVPAELAYGSKGAGPIPPDSALIFRIQLIEIGSAKPADAK
ncbi:FKBP-type peptidyl-prolyl cis-trans isomerase [Sphingorhabdus contaminans]|uniref:FKBP-type peptidyl-prolyl cis-trans isomerase n=1 Tax=Sphingorhabdus contaminans TaxID=1343899 RepID=UPI003D274A28